MRIGRDLLCVLMLLAWCASARAAPRASLVFADAPRDGSWEMVLIQLDGRPSESTLFVRDARGGTEFGRAIPAGKARQIVMSLPLLAAERLRGPGGMQWPLELRMTPGAATTDQTVTVSRPIEGETRRAFRIVVPAGANRGPGDLAKLGPLEPFVLAQIPEEEILTAPPLIFAGCDAVYIDDELAEAMGPQRAQALMAAGVRLVYSGIAAPANLSALSWDAVASSSLRIAPLEHARLAPPSVIEPGLEWVAAKPMGYPMAFKVTALALTPAVILLVICARIITHRPGVIAAILAVALAAGVAMTISTLGGAAPHIAEEVSWKTRLAPGNVAISETVTLYGSLLGERADMTTGDPVPPLPVAASASQWLSLGDASVLLGTGATADARRSHVFNWVGPRRTRAYVSRSLTREWPLPGSPEDPLWREHVPDHHIDIARGVMVQDGRVRDATAESGRTEVITKWIARQPLARRRALDVWYQFRFAGAKRYYLQPGETGLLVVDFGIPAAAP